MSKNICIINDVTSKGGCSVKVFLGITEEKLGNVMRKYRTEHNYTQKKLANYLGIDRTTYSKYETVRKPELDVIMKLAVLYDVSVDEFLKDFFTTKPDKASPFAAASSPEEKTGDELFMLNDEEKQLLYLYRDCIRKNELLEKAREIWSEDSDIKNPEK